MSFIPITALLFFPIDLLISSMFPSIIIVILYFSHIFENLLFVLSELYFETITNFIFLFSILSSTLSAPNATFPAFIASPTKPNILLFINNYTS